MTPEQFCNKHDACKPGRDWALSTGCQTMHQLWDHPDLKPEWAIWIATRKGVMSGQNLRLFSVWCCRQVQHLMADPRSVAAVDVVERFTNGEATEGELRSARASSDAARAAAWAAVWAASSDAAWAASRAAAWAAAWAAYSDASSDAAWAAAWAASSDAAWAAASDAARAAQHQQVRTYNLNLD